MPAEVSESPVGRILNTTSFPSIGWNKGTSLPPRQGNEDRGALGGSAFGWVRSIRSASGLAQSQFLRKFSVELGVTATSKQKQLRVDGVVPLEQLKEQTVCTDKIKFVEAKKSVKGGNAKQGKGPPKYNSHFNTDGKNGDVSSVNAIASVNALSGMRAGILAHDTLHTAKAHLGSDLIRSSDGAVGVMVDNAAKRPIAPSWLLTDRRSQPTTLMFADGSTKECSQVGTLSLSITGKGGAVQELVHENVVACDGAPPILSLPTLMRGGAKLRAATNDVTLDLRGCGGCVLPLTNDFVFHATPLSAEVRARAKEQVDSAKTQAGVAALVDAAVEAAMDDDDDDDDEGWETVVPKRGRAQRYGARLEQLAAEIKELRAAMAGVPRRGNAYAPRQ